MINNKYVLESGLFKKNIRLYIRVHFKILIDNYNYNII